jgi:succinate dehydrogenase hydrophobic anchor subunit
MAWAQRITAVVLCAFWVLFSLDHEGLPANVVNVEWAFVLPDLLVIAAGYGLASHWILRQDPRAGIATAAAGGALFYLGFLDAMLNIREGKYTESLSRGLLNAVVNLSCLVFGAACIRYAMKTVQEPL